MILGCPDCGTIQSVPPLPSRAVALCRVCDNPLEQTAGRSLDAALAFATAAFLLIIPANLLPFLEVSAIGITGQSLLSSGVGVLWREGWLVLPVLIGAFAVVLPVAYLGLLVFSLGILRLGWRPPWLGAAYRWASNLSLWAMADVFLVGTAVGYSRVIPYLPVRLGSGAWCFIAAAFLTMLCHACTDERGVWRAIAPPPPRLPGPCLSCTTCCALQPIAAEGHRCPRCGARLSSRKQDPLVRTTALVSAGFLLYFPANIYPMANQIQLGQTVPHTILSGIEQLVKAHLWPLAILIFFTSISIPVLKLVALSWFLLSVRRKSPHRLRTRARLYRVLHLIGRWSNVDVFTIAVYAPLMQFGQLGAVRAGLGATAFLLVVVLTMVATRSFDPRVMWDAAQGGRQ
jgi:paraquat-inducible protein A